MPTADFKVYTSATGEQIRLYMSDRCIANHRHEGAPVQPEDDSSLFYAKVRIPSGSRSMIDVRFHVSRDTDGELVFSHVKPAPRFTRIDKAELILGDDDVMLEDAIEAELLPPEKDWDEPKGGEPETPSMQLHSKRYHHVDASDIPAHVLQTAIETLNSFRDRVPQSNQEQNLESAYQQMADHVLKGGSLPYHENHQPKPEKGASRGRPSVAGGRMPGRGHHAISLVEEALADQPAGADTSRMLWSGMGGR